MCSGGAGILWLPEKQIIRCTLQIVTFFFWKTKNKQQNKQKIYKQWEEYHRKTTFCGESITW